jgi:Histone methylation protein DOT1
MNRSTAKASTTGHTSSCGALLSESATESAAITRPQSANDATPITSRPPRSLVVAGFIAGTTVLGTLALISPFVFTRSPLPYMATPGIKVRKALEFVMEHHHHHHHHYNQKSAIVNKNRSLTFVDMGSGDGEAVYQATQLGGYKHAIGIEINWTLVALSRLRRKFFWTKEQQSRSTFLYQDMLLQPSNSTSTTSTDAHLSSCHACMIFGVPSLMETLSQKLARTCQPGTHILSYRFLLPTANSCTSTTTITERRSDLLHADIVYDEQEMRIYKVTASLPSLDSVVQQQQQQQQEKIKKTRPLSN